MNSIIHRGHKSCVISFDVVVQSLLFSKYIYNSIGNGSNNIDEGECDVATMTMVVVVMWWWLNGLFTSQFMSLDTCL